VAAGVRAGLVATATTLGVIVGLGLRHQSALRPFLIAGRSVLTSTTGILAPAPVAITVGVLVHAFWMLLWGVCFSIVATPLRGLTRGLAALVVVGLAALLAWTVLPGALGAGVIAAHNTAQTLFLLSLLALSLLAGIRLARE
jgi:hypothetical protein